jgi:dipeptidyl aminopeptidase/acylaminoacyl peptidase
LAAFTALQRRNVPSRLLVNPDENHWVLKPKASIQWYDEVFGWMSRWMGSSAPQAEPAAASAPSGGQRG